jgi:hypothetical protein
VHRAHFACLAVVGIVLMLALRGAEPPAPVTVVLYPALCVGTMLLGMRALQRDDESDPVAEPNEAEHSN